MSWKIASPILYVALMFLLVGDLGSQISADAKVIVCDKSWHAPLTPKGHYLCAQADIPPKTKNGKPTPGASWMCSWCGRGDGKPSSCYDCVNENNESVTGPNGSWDCPIGIDVRTNVGPRPLVCSRLEGGVQTDYYCARRHLDNNCPPELCKIG